MGSPGEGRNRKKWSTGRDAAPSLTWTGPGVDGHLGVVVTVRVRHGVVHGLVDHDVAGRGARRGEVIDVPPESETTEQQGGTTKRRIPRMMAPPVFWPADLLTAGPLTAKSYLCSPDRYIVPPNHPGGADSSFLRQFLYE